MEVIIAAIAGIVTGAIGSLAAPWANWGVEKVRLRQSRRAALIEEARRALDSPPSNKEFRHSELYSRLRPHLSAKAIEAIEGRRDKKGTEIHAVVIGGGRGGGVVSFPEQETCQK